MDTERSIRVSVIMIITGTDKGLSRRLGSVTDQLSVDDEVLLITREDDEGTAASTVMQGAAVKVIAGANFPEKLEAAFSHATGQYLFLAESCDTWHPGKRVACIAALEQGAMAVVHDAVVVDGDLNELAASLLGHRFLTGLFSCLFDNRLMGCCVTFCREVLAVALPIPLKVSYDRWFIAAARGLGPISFIDRALIFYCSPHAAAGKRRIFGIHRKQVSVRELYSMVKLNRRIRKHYTKQPHQV